MKQNIITSRKETDLTNLKPQPRTFINPEKVWKALQDLYDLTEAAMLPYVLLGDAADQMHRGVDGFNGNNLAVDRIEWGMFKRNLTPEIESLFRTWNFEPWDSKGFMYMSGEVPVFVRVITRNYHFLEVPDTVYYATDIFKTPNPFRKYWPARFLIK